jgi:hypothetical protein
MKQKEMSVPQSAEGRSKHSALITYTAQRLQVFVDRPVRDG